MRDNDFSWDDIILEAPGDDALDEGGDELSATDYASDNVEIEEGEPADELEADDYTAEDEEGETDSEEDVLNDEENEEGDPADEDPLSDEEGGGEGDPADEDPLSDEEGGEEDVTADEESEEVSDVSSDKQNINLVNDFIELYNRMGEIMEQLTTNCKTNIRYNPNIITVRRNLTKLRETTHDYIINRFTKESYVSNLYQFNLIIQALNVNIDLLSSVIDSNKKFQEKEEKKPKRRNKK